MTFICKSIFHKETSNWSFIGKIDSFIRKYFWYMLDFFCFFLSDSNIWYRFLYFVVTLIAAVFHAQMFFNCSNSLMIELVVPFIYTIIQFRLSITSGNHEAMHTTKQSFSTNDHATIFSLLIHIDFDLVSSHLKWVIFNIAKLYPFFFLPYLNSNIFSALHDKHLRMEI